MKSLSKNYSVLFLSLTKTIKAFVREVKKHRLQDVATEKWTVKDVLCHVAFWHDYYAQNYASMAAGTKPDVFISKGGSTRNQNGVDKLRHKSRKDLITLLNKAQSSLYKSIVIAKVPKMAYIVGSNYKTEDFLEIIIGHIQRHTTQVRRSKKANK
jgi:hypothetical protein